MELVASGSVVAAAVGSGAANSGPSRPDTTALVEEAGG